MSTPDLATFTASVILARPAAERMSLFIESVRTYRRLIAGHPICASFAVRAEARRFSDEVLRQLEGSTTGDFDGWRGSI